MEFDFKLLGSNIRKRRHNAGLTQEQLAELAGCSDSHIGQIENARGRPSIVTVTAIANALNVGVDQLVYGGLKNQTDYFIQELVNLTEDFEGKDKLMVIDMVKTFIKIVIDYKK